MICPKCQAEGKTSRVTEGGSFSTAMYCPPTYDEKGRRVGGDGNTTTTEYTCTNGHRFEVKSGGGDDHVADIHERVALRCETCSMWATFHGDFPQKLVCACGSSLVESDGVGRKISNVLMMDADRQAMVRIEEAAPVRWEPVSLEVKSGDD